MYDKAMSEIMKIPDPSQRLIAAIIYQAIEDALSPTPLERGGLSSREEADRFLNSRGGVYDYLVSYNIKEIYELAKQAKV